MLLTPINWDNKPKWQYEMFKDFGCACAFTGREENITLDHLIPRQKSYGEVTSYTNLLPICFEINASKNDKHLFAWFENNGERLGITEERFRKAIEYVADKLGMSFEQYREYYDRMFYRETAEEFYAKREGSPSAAVIDFRKTKFIMVPRSLVNDDELTQRDKVAYMTLCLYANNDTKQAYPSVDTLARVTGCSRSSMFRALASLEANGYIKKEQRFIGKQKQTTNMYYLLDKN